MRNENQHQIDRAVIKSLRDCGGRLIPVDALITSVGIKLDFARPSRAEIEDAIRHLETNERLIGTSTETGMKYKITEAGVSWALEVRL